MRDRLEMVRLSDAGMSVPWIATHLNLHSQTVRKFIKSFLVGGFDALGDKPRPGKVSEMTAPMKDALFAEVCKGGRTWTAAQMAAWLNEHYGLTLSKERVALHMRRRGLVYKRTSRSLKHKQDADAVVAARTTLELLKGGPKAS
jgi:transposase